MVNGHPNLVKIYLYKNLALIIAIFILSAFASTHLVACSITTKIYLFPIYFPVGLIRPIKSKPHSIKGFFGAKIKISITK